MFHVEKSRPKLPAKALRHALLAVSLLVAMGFPSTYSVVAEVGGIPSTNAAGRSAVESLSAGWGHVCTIRSEGFPVCWGQDNNGAVDTVYGNRIIGDSVADMGGSLARIIPRDANNNPIRSSAVYAGGGFTCIKDTSGGLRCWGANESGQLGMGISQSYWTVPAGTPIDLGSDVIADVALGGQHSSNSGRGFVCALFTNGSIKCWGSNSSGQLGIGDTTSPKDKIGDASGEMGSALQAVDLGAGVVATAVAAGFDYACAIAEGGTRNLPSGSVLCWGANSLGQLGIGSISSPNDKIGDAVGEMGNALAPVNIGTGRSALAIVANDYGPCILRDDNTVICWGKDFFGNLGQNYAFGTTIGDSPNEVASLPAINLGLSAGETVRLLVSGFSHNCAVTTAERIKCWGGNSNGQLGIGSTTDIGTSTNTMASASAFVDFGLLAGETIDVLTAGARFNCVRISSGSVKCWGSNSHNSSGSGALGIGDIASPKNNIGDASGEMGSALVAVDFVPTTPTEPLNMVATGGNRSLSITFDAPANTYGAITGYDHWCKELPSGAFPSSRTDFSSLPLVLSTLNSSPLTNGKSYQCRIRVKTASGVGVEGYVSGTAGTPLTVTASSHTVALGAPVPTISGTPSVQGVSRTGETCSTTYTQSSPAGTYPTTCTGGSASGYVVSYVPGTVTVTPPPTVASVSPVSGPAAGGTSLTVTGTGFLSGASVTVGGAACASVTVVSATSITCTAPAGAAGAQDVVVTNTDTQSGTGSGLFRYVAAPSVTSVSPSSGSTDGGASLTITGTGFLSGASVTVGGAACTSVAVVSATSITCVAPAGTAGAQDVVVTNTDGQLGTGSGLFSFEVPPTTTVTPTTLAISQISGEVTPTTLVGASNAATVAAVPGTGEALVDGKPVPVELLNVDIPAASKEPEQRSPAEVKAIQEAANDLVGELNDLLPQGEPAPVNVRETPTGAELVGITDVPVPVEDVAAVKTTETAVLVAGTDSTGQKTAASDSGGVLEIVDGGQVATVAYGLTPGAPGELYMLSTPILLDTFKVGSNGTFKRQTKLPATLEPGEHTVVVATPKLTVSLGLKVRERALPVREAKVYTTLPARAHVSTAMTVLSVEQAGSRRIHSLTPVVCLGTKYDVVFLNEGRCLVQIKNAKSGKVVRSLVTIVGQPKRGQKTIGTKVASVGPVLFETGTTGIRARGSATLRAAKKAMSDATSILVVGHSGSALGNTAQNQRLSGDRAAQIRSLLVKGGVRTSIAAYGLGALDPVTKMVYEFAQRENRRVVVYLIP
jgi:alpha-tubulin suppressor-like RCC1 family protein/outer membrane protein OmpA-like peptidoglycan-associated protein